MGKLVVHGVHFSICTRRVLMALEEKGASYEIKPVDLAKGEHKSPEFLAQQPFGQIPVLYDDDFKVYESLAVCRYVDDTVSGQQLVPKDAKQKALVEQWISIEECNFEPAKALVHELFVKKLFGLTTDNAVVEESKKKLETFLKIWNTHLEGKSFIVGDSLTLADIAFMPHTEYLVQSLNDVFSAYPNVDRWWKNVSSRPTWKKILDLGKK